MSNEQKIPEYKRRIYAILGIILAIVFTLFLVMMALLFNSVSVRARENEKRVNTYQNEIVPYNAIYSKIEREPDYTYLTAAAVTEKTTQYSLTEDEYKMISITTVNADFTNDEVMMCVIRVIRNRLESDKFPGTIEEVLRQKGQFENCERVAGYAKDHYDYDRIKALIDKVFIDGCDPFDGESAIFYAKADIKPHKIARGLYLVKECGDSKFWGQK